MAKRKLEEPSPEKSGVHSEKEGVGAPSAKVPKFSPSPIIEDPKTKFAKVPGPLAERPPVKGVFGHYLQSPSKAISS